MLMLVCLGGKESISLAGCLQHDSTQEKGSFYREVLFLRCFQFQFSHFQTLPSLLAAGKVWKLKVNFMTDCSAVCPVVVIKTNMYLVVFYLLTLSCLQYTNYSNMQSTNVHCKIYAFPVTCFLVLMTCVYLISFCIKKN